MRITTVAFLLLLSTAAFAADLQLGVLGLFSGKAMLMVGGERYTLSVGESTPEGVTLIAADSNKAIIEINGRQRQLSLGSQISSRFSAAKKNIVHIAPDNSGMYRVNGSINGLSVNFLVDTGASSIAMSSKEAKRLNIDYQETGVAGIAETASSRVKVYNVTLDRVTVDSIQLYGVKAAVLEGDMPGQVLLGQSFLNRVHMKRDGVLLRLEQNR